MTEVTESLPGARRLQHNPEPIKVVQGARRGETLADPSTAGRCIALVGGANWRCMNTAVDERYGLDVCGVHRNMVDRTFSTWGDEYVRSYVLRNLWRQNPTADTPRLNRA